MWTPWTLVKLGVQDLGGACVFIHTCVHCVKKFATGIASESTRLPQNDTFLGRAGSGDLAVDTCASVAFLNPHCPTTGYSPCLEFSCENMHFLIALPANPPEALEDVQAPGECGAAGSGRGAPVGGGAGAVQEPPGALPAGLLPHREPDQQLLRPGAPPSNGHTSSSQSPERVVESGGLTELRPSTWADVK